MKPAVTTIGASFLARSTVRATFERAGAATAFVIIIPSFISRLSVTSATTAVIAPSVASALAGLTASSIMTWSACAHSDALFGPATAAGRHQDDPIVTAAIPRGTRRTVHDAGPTSAAGHAVSGAGQVIVGFAAFAYDEPNGAARFELTRPETHAKDALGRGALPAPGKAMAV